MGDMGDTFKIWDEHYKDIRKSAKEKRLNFLKESNIDYKILSATCGHVRINFDNTCYDVWLSTGRWTKTGSNVYQQGWTQFLNLVDEKTNQRKEIKEVMTIEEKKAYKNKRQEALKKLQPALEEFMNEFGCPHDSLIVTQRGAEFVSGENYQPFMLRD